MLFKDDSMIYNFSTTILLFQSECRALLSFFASIIHFNISSSLLSQFSKFDISFSAVKLNSYFFPSCKRRQEERIFLNIRRLKHRMPTIKWYIKHWQTWYRVLFPSTLKIQSYYFFPLPIWTLRSSLLFYFKK